MAHQWQDDFPVAEVLAIGPAIRGGDFDTTLIREAWVVVEYGLGQLIYTAASGHPRSLGAAPLDPEEAMDQLVAHAHAHQHSDASQRMALPPLSWKAILEAVLPMLLAEIRKSL